jgi:hypothetical protein
VVTSQRAKDDAAASAPRAPATTRNQVSAQAPPKSQAHVGADAIDPMALPLAAASTALVQRGSKQPDE